MLEKQKTKFFFLVLLLIMALPIFLVIKLSINGNLSNKNQIFSDSYQFSLNKKPVSLVEEIAVFDDNENWIGDSDFDYNYFVQGKSSLSLSSLNGSVSKTVLNLSKGFNFFDYSKIKLFINLGSSLSNLSDLILYFSDKNTGIVYKYKIFDVKSGWNFVTISTNDFVTSEKLVSLEKSRKNFVADKLTLELKSTAKATVSVNFDYLWAEKEDNYLDDWLVSSTNFFSLNKNNLSLNLFSNGVPGIAVVKKIENLKDFELRSKFNPISGGAFGFFVRGDINGAGYYFVVQKDVYNLYWQISKLGDFGKDQNSIVLGNGMIDRIIVNGLQDYWLKVIAKGDNFAFYISPFDNNYTLIGKMRDSSFSSGRIGIANINGSLFKMDNFKISKMTFK